MRKRRLQNLLSATMFGMFIVGILLPYTPVLATGTSVAINEKNFPDANFRAYISNQKIDQNQDASLSKEEIEAVKKIDCNGYGKSDKDKITDLTGIQYFTNLIELYCNSNQLTELDVSRNKELTSLDCNSNQLTELDVSQYTKLTYLYCSYNQLTELDVSQNTELTRLDCNGNQLTELDVSQNKELTILDCSSNPLTKLDVSQNTKLTYLNCDYNPLTELDVSRNTKLTYLYCNDNQLTDLDVSQNTNLTDLDCDSNQLTELDVSQNTNLIDLSCSSNKLTQLDVRQNTKLIWLYCYRNQLIKLDVSQNTNLTYLFCNGNQLTELDVRQNTKLIKLDCSYNQLSNLDLRNNNLESSNLADNAYVIADGASLTELNGFEVKNTTNIKGGTFVQGKVNYNEGSNVITYTYDCGNGMSETFTLKKHTRYVIEIPEKKPTCTQDGKRGSYFCICCKRYFEDEARIKKIKDIKTWGIIKAKGHIFSTNYLLEHADENKHYHVCTNPNCKEKDQGEAHTFVWVTDKVATTTEKGLKHEECSVCKYKKAAVEIPVISVPVVKGEKVVDKKTKSKFRVLKSDEKTREVQYTGATSKKLKTVKIPDTIVMKGITYRVTSIAKDAFKNNKYLQKVIVGKNIKKIDKKAFYGCKKLKSVTLDKDLTVIENEAFKNCTSLTKITIPSKVIKIDKGAFYGCKKLKKMTIKSKKLKNVGKNAIKNINKKAYIDVPKSKVKAYKKLFKSKTGYKKSMKLK